MAAADQFTIITATMQIKVRPEQKLNCILDGLMSRNLLRTGTDVRDLILVVPQAESKNGVPFTYTDHGAVTFAEMGLSSENNKAELLTKTYDVLGKAVTTNIGDRTVCGVVEAMDANGAFVTKYMSRGRETLKLYTVREVFELLTVPVITA